MDAEIPRDNSSVWPGVNISGSRLQFGSTGCGGRVAAPARRSCKRCFFSQVRTTGRREVAWETSNAGWLRQWLDMFQVRDIVVPSCSHARTRRAPEDGGDRPCHVGGLADLANDEQRLRSTLVASGSLCELKNCANRTQDPAAFARDRRSTHSARLDSPTATSGEK